MKLNRSSKLIVVGHLETSVEDPSVVPPPMSASEALRMLEQSNLYKAPVVEHGERIGSVLTQDLRTSGAVESMTRQIPPARSCETPGWHRTATCNSGTSWRVSSRSTTHRILQNPCHSAAGGEP